MSLSEKKIGFIGCGKMGKAIIKGLVDSGLMNGNKISGFDVADTDWAQTLSEWGWSRPWATGRWSPGPMWWFWR